MSYIFVRYQGLTSWEFDQSQGTCGHFWKSTLIITAMYLLTTSTAAAATTATTATTSAAATTATTTTKNCVECIRLSNGDIFSTTTAKRLTRRSGLSSKESRPVTWQAFKGNGTGLDTGLKQQFVVAVLWFCLLNFCLAFFCLRIPRVIFP